MNIREVGERQEEICIYAPFLQREDTLLVVIQKNIIRFFSVFLHISNRKERVVLYGLLNCGGIV